MKRLIILVFALFLFGCDSKEKEIFFESEQAHFNYCLHPLNIDGKDCEYYKTIVLSSALVLGRNPCARNSILKDTKACTEYIHTKKFKDDLSKKFDYCKINKDDKKCVFLNELMKEVVDY